MQDLKIALTQFDIVWQNPEANRKLLEAIITSINSNVDLIILPEMFTTGFTMDTVEHAEPLEGDTIMWMRKMAKSANAVITGSIIIIEGEHYYNRLLWVTPKGESSYYDKRHLFRMADEHAHFSAGKNQPVFELKGWRIKPQICYDLRFPVWSRNTQLEYDLIFYVANWPKARINAWDTLLKARAIENLSYSIGVNRVGIDGAGKTYNGHTACYNYKGDLLGNMVKNEVIVYINLLKEDLDNYRKSFPAHLDSDTFIIDNIS